MKRAAAGLFAAVALLCGAASAKDRHLAVIIDTSGSMEANDPSRYTVQAAKILSDLLDDQDRMLVLRMPNAETCSDGPNPALGVTFNAADRGGFKASLDTKMALTSGTYFVAPVRTGLDFLSSAPGGQRLLVILADSDGFDKCDTPLKAAITAFRRTGGASAVVNIGRSTGAFFQSPAFSAAHAARDSRELINAIAAIYQGFLGSKSPQTGDVGGRIEVTIDKLVAEAFLVVAADGPLGTLRSDPQNPGAAQMDLDLYGGGQTRGEDQQVRGYRIARLSSPKAGKWVFDASDISGAAGYMLLQSYAVEVRMVTPDEVVTGRNNKVTFEIIDPTTGKRVTDPDLLRDAQLTVDDGQKKVDIPPDADGTFSTELRFDDEGPHLITTRFKNSRLEKTATKSLRAVRSTWVLVPQVPSKAELEVPVKLAVRVEPSDASRPSPGAYPDRILVAGADPPPELLDNGQGGDERAGDHIYTATWAPSKLGSLKLHFSASGGQRAAPASASIDVLGKLRFGEVNAIDIGPVRSESSGMSALNLENAEVKGQFDVHILSTFASGGAALEIDVGDGFQLVGSTPVTLRLETAGARQFPIRLRTGACPAGCSKQESTTLTLRTTGPDGASVEVRVPLLIEVVPDPWLHCYWPFLALGAGLAFTGFVVHGFWSPSRFGRRLGVKLSPEEDIEEGVFYTIRAQPGTRSGFYSDARVYISADFRVSGDSKGAIARLRAEGPHVMIRPEGGATLLRQTSDGEWEELDASETRGRFGTLYCNDKRSIYFQLRSG